MRLRRLGALLIGIGLIGSLAAIWYMASGRGAGFGQGRLPDRFQASCQAPALPGQVVDVTLSDSGMMQGGMMGNAMMGRGSITVSPSSVGAGEVSFRVLNAGTVVHELVILPLPSSGAGSRATGADGTVSETGSLGEASATCGEGTGEGIAPGAAAWVTLQLPAGRYELICNLPGHYASGMFAELDVR